MNSNLYRLKTIALALEEMRDQVVFVGGSAIELYIDDSGAPTPQPSEDIDCVVEIITYGQWCEFEKKLRQKGFRDTDPRFEDKNSPTCRKFLMGMKVDFMPIEKSVLGYSNRWFKIGLKNYILKKVEDIEIKIFPLAYLVASKIQAFNDRGVTGDIRFSQDLEDLTELMDGCINFELEISNSDKEVRQYILDEFFNFRHSSNIKEAMFGFLSYDDQITKEFRLKKIFQMLERITTK